MKTETELKQENALLIKMIEEIVAYNESCTMTVQSLKIKRLLEPYYVSKIQAWNKWRHTNGKTYMMCCIDGKYQLNTLDGSGFWTDPKDTQTEAFGNSFHEFTKVED